MTRLLSFVVAAFIGIVTTVDGGADWPQYRFDANRSAASAEALPASLHLLWTRELATPRPAFPTEIRLGYDATYEPVVLGEMMFVPSMVTDSVTALDTETGQERWRFFAEGPVRLAPAAWRDKVYFVSDDGFLYCVDAADGRLHWKFRGLPADREDRKVMGNGRLVSLYPAQGGPVLADGIVYFAAGIWSGEGVFVHALNAQTGDVVWSNTDSDRIEKANADHGVANYAGISPQGHLAIVADTLVVPCGAQLPALLELKTGKLQTYTMGWGGRNGLPKGCAFVSGVGKYLLHAGDLYDLGEAKQTAPLNRRGQQYDVRRMVHLGALTRLQVDRSNQKTLGEFREPVLTPRAMYYQQNGIVAYDLAAPELQKRSQTQVPAHRRDDVYPDPSSVVFPELWKLSSRSRVHIKAGNRLYCGRPGMVEAVDIPGEGQEPKTSWQAPIDGTPHRMLSADDKLFVVTRDGRIYAFGGTKPAKLVAHTLPDSETPADDRWTKQVADILKVSGITDGYALVLGLENGRLAEEIVRQSKCDVIVIDEDTEKVAAVREQFQRVGLYGTRVSVYEGDPLKYSFPPYLASLIVAGDEDVVGKAQDGGVVKSWLRVLRPYGGTAVLGIPDTSLSKASGGDDFREGQVSVKGGFILLTRKGPLSESADWSHAGANAANTGASEDRHLKAPLTRLWFDSSFRWHRKPGATTVRVAGGRILVRSDKLYAIDAFTGRHLWEAAAPPSNGEFVAVEDAIYISQGSSCVVLDPATGKQSGEMSFPGDDQGGWSHLRVSDGVMVAAQGERLVCIDRKSGKLRWDHECDNNVGSIALGGGRVFCVDAINRRKNEVPADKPGGAAKALDVQTGEVLWQAPAIGEVRYGEPLDVLVVGKDVLQAKDGKRMRSGLAAGQTMVLGGKLLFYGTAPPPERRKRPDVVVHDLLTGEAVGSQLEWFRRGCTPLRASSHLLTTRYLGNAAYVDLAGGKITSIWNVRAACSNNLFPADGVLCLPNLSGGCTCNYMPISQGFVPASAFE